uniref:NADH-ubiquinone oxidoreductase chain 6 n=1 Tax=Otolithes ruber TaxID=334907 RepID=A0A1P8SCC6_9TELE|nr:NADH dehydrogenase subunit 6 [Otolithes ruber]APY18430.1 NADH dehydrogenase subunit 6 [Otolithes ruber]
MLYSMAMCLFGVLLGSIGVVSNPSPYFAALGLVVVAGMGCGVLVGHGGHFLALVLFLIYLGGMLVVFAYSAALAAEPYPESWGSRNVLMYGLVYVLCAVLISGFFWEGWYETSWLPVEELGKKSTMRSDSQGVALMYCAGGGMLVISAWALLLTLIVVLELTRGLSRGSIRAV